MTNLEIDTVIEKGKEILSEHHKQTFHKYREVGQLVLASGYRKGQWNSEDRKKALEEWAISRQTFDNMVNLGLMTETEFANAVSEFPSVHAWANRGRPTELRPLPEVKFDIIYADPPWEYRVKHRRGSPEKHYPTMTLDQICNIEIPASENAVLFLWGTNPLLEEALKVMDAWGFKYKSNMVWVKDKFGTGFYFRGQHELLLVGVKGDVHPPTESNRFPSVLQAPVKEHSEKPTEVYDIIEKMYPNATYLELFARKQRLGWQAWGNEV